VVEGGAAAGDGTKKEGALKKIKGAYFISAAAGS